MYENYHILAIIPARGGSKGIPRKNIRFLAGRPLISYIIKVALASKYIDDIIVSTDDTEIAEIAKIFGAKNIIYRPKYLAEDNVTLTPVIVHAVTEFEKENKKRYDIVITLQPTSPLLKTKSIDKAIEKFVHSHYSTLISSKEVRHLFWEKADDSYKPYYSERLNRQQLSPVFFETGGFVISKRENLDENVRIKQPLSLFLISEEEGIDIDNFTDWIVTESLLSRKKIFIRVDGSREIGLGHIYRTLTLANELTAHEITFIMKKQYSLGIKKVSSYHYDLITIENDNEFIELIKKQRPDIVILDILDTSEELFSKLISLNVFIASFEDMGAGYKYADVVFNALYESKESIRREGIFTGYKYICLREEFYLVPEKTVSEKVKKILVTFGGTDQNNLSFVTLHALKELKIKDIKITIIVGLGYHHFDELKNSIAELNKIGYNIKLLQDVKFMARYMAEADIIITSNGRTIFEVASIGVPCISISQNERETKHTFAVSSKGIDYLGQADDTIKSRIKEALEELIYNFDKRKEMNKQLLRYDMKGGVKRVINTIFEYYDSKYNK